METSHQTHQETLRILRQNECMYAHEADAIDAAIAALDEIERQAKAREAVRAEWEAFHAVYGWALKR